MECLETNKVCSEFNKKCKVCKLDSCKEVIKMIQTQEEREDRFKLECIKVQLNKQCRNCSLLKIIDLNKQKVYCPYMIKDKCIIKEV